ncbi:DMT family transporter [Roseivivax sediminis]|uniref:EamA domain-containing membrane protein RarD n=1 Tax=Roseivivax sediminis TaxID=936889 RepID=A0A1I1VJW9_9RHOB|nr:DMT family transporter [Roseivivax sediminis]SFD80800.1 EamA domain-containing membrane protein RarD [Roseivivax sediminis]
MTHSLSLRRALFEGVGLRLLAIFLLTAMSAAVHAAAKTVPVGQIVFWRSFLALGPICFYMHLRGGFRAGLRTRRPGAHALRGGLGAVSVALSFLSLAYLPVASAEALSFLAPILTLPLAALVLKERIGPTAILSVLIGLAGVALMLWSALELPTEGAAIGVAAGLGFALVMAVVRVQVKDMTRSEAPSTIAFYMSVITSLAALGSAPFGWTAPPPEAWVPLLATGIFGGLAAIAGTEAVARAPVATLAPIEYTGLVWALLFDVVLFATLPTWQALLGALTILAAAALATFGTRR